MNGKRIEGCASAVLALALGLAPGASSGQQPFSMYDFEDETQLDDFFNPAGLNTVGSCGAPSNGASGTVRTEGGEVVLTNGPGTQWSSPMCVLMLKPRTVGADFPQSRDYTVRLRFKLETTTSLGLYLRARVGVNEEAGTIDLMEAGGYGIIVGGELFPGLPEAILAFGELPPCGGSFNTRDEYPGNRGPFALKLVDPGVASLQHVWYRLEVSLQGSDRGGPVHVTARVWRDGDERPEAPQLAAVDPDGLPHSAAKVDPATDVQLIFWTSWDLQSGDPQGSTCRLDDLSFTELEGCGEPPVRAARSLWHEKVVLEASSMGVYEPGTPYGVRIALTDLRRANTCAAPDRVQVLETVPPGLAVSDVSHGGAVNGRGIRWDLDLSAAGPETPTLSYEVVPHRRDLVVGAFNGEVREEENSRPFAVSADNRAVSADLASAVSELGNIRHWLILGPFGREVGGPAPGEDQIRRDYLTPDCSITELDIRPRPGDTLRPDFGNCAASTELIPTSLDRNPGGLPTWIAWRDTFDTIVLEAVYGDVDEAMCYALTYLEVLEDTEVNFTVEFNDSIQVFLDGRVLHIHNSSRGGESDSPSEFPGLGNVKLGPGLHFLLLKVFDGFDPFLFRVAFVDEQAAQIPGGPQGVRVLLTPDSTFRRGDADADGRENLTDAIFALNFLFRSGDEPSCGSAADTNDDGLLDITDAIYSLNWLFQGGAPPPAPGPESCGPDPTPNAPSLPDCKYRLETCELPCEEPPLSASRTLWPGRTSAEGIQAALYENGKKHEVRIDLSDPRPVGECGAATRATVVESVPAGWAVSDVAPGGTVRGSTIRWDLDLPGALPSLTYKLTPGGGGPGTFAGEVREPGNERWFPVAGDSLGATAEAVRAVSDFGSIQHWLILGPFLRDGAHAPGEEQIRRDYLTDGQATERTVRPRAGDTIVPEYGGAAASKGLVGNFPGRNPGGIPTWIEWRDLDDSADRIDFESVYGFVDSVMCHAVTYLDAAETTTVNLGVSSDDSVQVLLDGTEVHIHNVGRGALAHTYQDTPFTEPRFPGLGGITLTPGRHVLLVKVFEGGGLHNFRVGFLDAEGKPIPGGPPGVRITLDPEGR